MFDSKFSSRAGCAEIAAMNLSYGGDCPASQDADSILCQLVLALGACGPRRCYRVVGYVSSRSLSRKSLILRRRWLNPSRRWCVSHSTLWMGLEALWSDLASKRQGFSARSYSAFISDSIVRGAERQFRLRCKSVLVVVQRVEMPAVPPRPGAFGPT